MSKSELAAFLDEHGFSQYLSMFESNSIGISDLPGLTGDDLKELGISALGHRKAILAAIQARSGGSVVATREVPQPTPVAQAIREEKTYLETKIAIVNGEFATIKVTNRRAMLGDKTYALQNIAAVEAYSNEADIERRHKVALDATKDLRMRNRLMLGGSGIALIGMAAVASTSSSFKNDFSVPGCCGMLGVALVLVGFRNIKDPEREKPIWSVRIQASGTSNDVVQSLSKEKIEEVVNALNEAIVNLNM